jgi:hypothetical protein
MRQTLTREVRAGIRIDPRVRWIGAIGLAIAVGIVYFLAAQLSFALTDEASGFRLFSHYATSGKLYWLHG